MKKLLLVNDFEDGGGAEQVYKDTQRLMREKYHVRTMADARHVKVKGALSYLYSFKNRKSALSRIYSLKNYARMLKHLSDFKPDVVHLHNFSSSLSPSILQAIKRYRKGGQRLSVVFTAHDYHLLCPFSSFIHYSRSGKIRRLDDLPGLLEVIFLRWDERGGAFSIAKKAQWVYAYTLKRLDTEIDHIISPSEFLGGLFRKKYPETPVTVIRNPALDSIEAARSSAQSNESASSTDLKMVYVGRLSPEKGLVEFIEAIKDLDDVTYSFKIIGDGPQREEISSMILRYGLSDRVLLTGGMTHQKALDELRGADALVLPSLWPENAPLSLVEGALANLRLLTANYGGMKELAGLCGGAHLMDPMDKASVRKAIRDCFIDRALNRPLARDKEMVSSAFSVSSYVRALSEVYDGSCKSRSV